MNVNVKKTTLQVVGVIDAFVVEFVKELNCRKYKDDDNDGEPTMMMMIENKRLSQAERISQFRSTLSKCNLQKNILSL